MKKVSPVLIILFAIMSSANAAPTINNSLSYKKKESSPIKKIISNFGFSYFAQYTGRSLSDDYAEGATYNRFGGGRTADGQRRDATSAYELFQAFSIKYKLPKNYTLSYGGSFQDNLTDNVEYEGDYGQTLTRGNGRSFNNHRLSLWIPSIYSGSNFSLSSTVFYEFPTNDFSKSSGMEYGYGFQPTLQIYSSIAGLSHGITASYARFVYSDYEFYEYYTPRNPDGTAWINSDGAPMRLRNNLPTKRQGMLGNIGGYLNYSLNDLISLKSSVQFDYSQSGNDVGSLNTFENNLDNIGNLGVGFNLAKQINLQTGVTFSLEEAGLDKSALFGSLTLRI